MIDVINGVDNGDIKLLTNIIHTGLGLSTELLTSENRTDVPLAVDMWKKYVDKLQHMDGKKVKPLDNGGGMV